MEEKRYNKLVSAYNKLKDKKLDGMVYYRATSDEDPGNEIVISRSGKDSAIFRISPHNEELAFYTEIDEDLQNIGLSTLLQFILLIKLNEYCLFERADSIIGICGDASDGFWRSLGMTPGRYSEEGDRAGTRVCTTGFDVEFTYTEWYKKIFGKPMALGYCGTMTGGSRKSMRRRRRRKSKRKKRSRRTRRRKRTKTRRRRKK